MGGSTDPSGPDFSQGIPVASVPDSRPLGGHVGDDPVMLVRLGGDLVALDSACPHYSADLSGGLVEGETVRCPLHHACFSLRTGIALEAPAFDSLGRWAVDIRDGMIFVAGRTAAPAAPRPSSADVEAVVIVGGGAAGFACAERLRRLGFSGGITMISADRDPPCDRPNLSKDFLAGTAPAEWIPLRGPDWYRDEAIGLELECNVTAIDSAAGTIATSDGRSFAWDRLLLAPGAEPVRLAAPGFDAGNVFYLRSLSDAEQIAARADAGTRAVIIGSGFIGLEAAAALRARGVRVAVVSAEDVPFERQLGREIGAFFRALHERNGVAFHMGRTAASYDGRSLNLDDGEVLDADFLLVGIGVRPRVELARAAGLAIGDGILVDAHLQTSIPGIYAAGDAAAFPDPATGESIRVEHWVVAERQGQAAAGNMIGGDTPFRDVPFFWTEQYGTALRYVGRAASWDEVRIAGDIESGDFTARYFAQGRLRASASVGRDFAALEDEQHLRRAIVEQAA